MVSKSFPNLVEKQEPTKLHVYKFFWLANLFLQPIRDAVNAGAPPGTDIPVRIESGWRSDELNEAVGGVKNSDHLYYGNSAAVDIKIGENTQEYVKTAFKVCHRRKNCVKQLILYYPSAGNFIHLSTIDGGGKVWQRLYCVSRENRIYFDSPKEARQFERRNE